MNEVLNKRISSSLKFRKKTMDDDFKKITEELQAKGISSEDYYSYLGNTYRALSHVEKESASSELNLEKISETLSEMEALEKIGLKLLLDTKVSVGELNNLVNSLPRGKVSARTLLQSLLQQKKITIDEFLELEQGNWTYAGENQNFYRIRSAQERPEFYIEYQQDDRIYGNYNILEEIARGGMGIVYRAYHPGLNQTFALKVLLKGSDASEDSLQRFFREIQATARLQHPHIIRVFDSGQKGQEHYFVMEFIEGGKTLADWLKEKHPIRDRVRVIQQSLEALHYAHTEGVIHRDIKPDNILITKEGIPKLTDFGLAKDQNQKSQNLTKSGYILGTTAYMPPEQVSGEIDKLDAKSDVYSMGVCLYEVLTGMRPFRAETDALLYEKIFKEEARLPSRINPEIHRDLDTITLKAMEKLRHKRYRSAGHFAEDLDLFLQGYPIKAKPSGWLEKILKWIKRNPQLLLGANFILLLCLLLFSQIWMYRKTHQNKINIPQDISDTQFLVKTWDILDQEQKKLEQFSLPEEKVVCLIKMWGVTNAALLKAPHLSSLKKKKEEVERFLFQLVCENKDNFFAEYLFLDLKELAPDSLGAFQKMLQESNR